MKKDHPTRIWTRPVRILLIFLVASAAIWAQLALGAHVDPQRATKAEWRLTSNAVFRTASGDCAADAATPVCRELCMISTRYGTVNATGRFGCFAD